MPGGVPGLQPELKVMYSPTQKVGDRSKLQGVSFARIQSLYFCLSGWLYL